MDRREARAVRPVVVPARSERRLHPRQVALHRRCTKGNGKIDLGLNVRRGRLDLPQRPGGLEPAHHVVLALERRDPDGQRGALDKRQLPHPLLWGNFHFVFGQEHSAVLAWEHFVFPTGAIHVARFGNIVDEAISGEKERPVRRAFFSVILGELFQRPRLAGINVGRVADGNRLGLGLLFHRCVFHEVWQRLACHQATVPLLRRSPKASTGESLDAKRTDENRQDMVGRNHCRLL
mmetsp:Transcript_65545/g.147913  ORF Transcript_65545/g.147913 Transcript_65545/m.147913 type:complete len:235 (-) Transcript_65545:46-750(-)